MQIKGHKSVFIINALRVLLLFIVLDFAVGSLMESLYLKQRSGKYYRITWSIEKTQADILIFGSSHAVRHLVPERFTNTLGLSCYNCGVQGKGIVFTTALQSLILDRYTPKTIVLNIDTDMLFESDVQYDRLGDLLPYFKKHHDTLEPFVALKSRFEGVKLLSRIYPYNSTIVHIARYWIAPQKDFDGYLPLHGQMSTSSIEETQSAAAKPSRAAAKKQLDDNFIAALKQFIENAHNSGTNIVFVVSPLYVAVDFSGNESLALIKEIAAKNKVPIFDYSSHPRFLGQHTLFRDKGHLNHEGALLFSSLAAEDIKHFLNSSP